MEKEEDKKLSASQAKLIIVISAILGVVLVSTWLKGNPDELKLVLDAIKAIASLFFMEQQL